MTLLYFKMRSECISCILHFISRAWNVGEAELGSEQQIIDAHLLEDSGAVINPNYPDGQVVICELFSKKYYISNDSK